MRQGELTKDDVLTALRDIEDPEVGTNIVDLGLIYDVTISETGAVVIDMTTTTRFCPASGFLADATRARVETLIGGRRVEVNLRYDPPWSPEMAKLFDLD